MKLSIDGMCLRPDEGTILDSTSLSALGGADHASLWAGLQLCGLPRHGFVMSGLRVTLGSAAMLVTGGSLLLPDSSGRLVVAPQPEALELPLPGFAHAMVVAEASEKRLFHGASGLQGAAKTVTPRLKVVDTQGLKLEEHLPVAWIDLDGGRVENDVCRLLQPDEPEVVELVRRLRAIVNARLVQEGARGQLEFQGQVQENLSARDFLYVSALQATLVQLRARPALSIERVRLVSELALQVRTLYRNHPRLREYIREIVAVGYVDHDHARQLRMESAAARFYNECYSPAAWRGGEGEV